MDKTIKMLNSMTNKALEDGIITDDERALLKSVFEGLKDYNWWLKDALNDGIIDLSEEEKLRYLLLRVFENSVKTALDDGVITDDERGLLDHLGRSFGIDQNVQNIIQTKLENEKS